MTLNYSPQNPECQWSLPLLLLLLARGDFQGLTPSGTQHPCSDFPGPLSGLSHQQQPWVAQNKWTAKRKPVSNYKLQTTPVWLERLAQKSPHPPSLDHSVQQVLQAVPLGFCFRTVAQRSLGESFPLWSSPKEHQYNGQNSMSLTTCTRQL